MLSCRSQSMAMVSGEANACSPSPTPLRCGGAAAAEGILGCADLASPPFLHWAPVAAAPACQRAMGALALGTLPKRAPLALRAVLACVCLLALAAVIHYGAERRIWLLRAFRAPEPQPTPRDGEPWTCYSTRCKEPAMPAAASPARGHHHRSTCRRPTASLLPFPAHVCLHADPVWQACHAQHVQDIAAADAAEEVSMQGLAAVWPPIAALQCAMHRPPPLA